MRLRFFRSLARANINVDMIIQNVGTNGATNLGFTVPENELDQAKNTMKEVLGNQVLLEKE